MSLRGGQSLANGLPMANKMADVKIHCKCCLLTALSFFVLILGLQSNVWINPSFECVSPCVSQ